MCRGNRQTQEGRKKSPGEGVWRENEQKRKNFPDGGDYWIEGKEGNSRRF